MAERSREFSRLRKKLRLPLLASALGLLLLTGLVTSFSGLAFMRANRMEQAGEAEAAADTYRFLAAWGYYPAKIQYQALLLRQGDQYMRQHQYDAALDCYAPMKDDAAVAVRWAEAQREDAHRQSGLLAAHRRKYADAGEPNLPKVMARIAYEDALESMKTGALSTAREQLAAARLLPESTGLLAYGLSCEQAARLFKQGETTAGREALQAAAAHWEGLEPNQSLTLVDSDFEAAVRKALGLRAEDVLYAAMLQNIKTLQLEGSGRAMFYELGAMTHLRSITFTGYDVVELSPLGLNPSLQSVTIQACGQVCDAALLQENGVTVVIEE